MKFERLIRYLPIVFAIFIGTQIAIWPSLKFVHISGTEFASRFSVIMFFSLLIERTVEILMSIWRSEKSNKLEAAVQRLIASNIPITDQKFIDAQESLINYKAETIQWTIPIGFALGVVVSAFGIRTLRQFIEIPTAWTDVAPEWQLWWFNMSDIIFTGALLAGGADPIHKLLDLYRKFADSSAAKAAGTKP